MNVTDRLHDLGTWLQGQTDIMADMQHEINVLKRQIAELRLVVFENGAVVSMPRLEKAMKEMSACNAQDAHVAQDANMAM